MWNRQIHRYTESPIARRSLPYKVGKAWKRLRDKLQGQRVTTFCKCLNGLLGSSCKHPCWLSCRSLSLSLSLLTLKLLISLSLYVVFLIQLITLYTLDSSWYLLNWYFILPLVNFCYLVLPLTTFGCFLITPYTIYTNKSSGSLLLLLDNLNISLFLEIPQDTIDNSG